MKRAVQAFIILSSLLAISYLFRPLHAEILLKSGVTYMDHGYLFKGIADLNKAKRLDPSNGKIYFQSGIAFGKLSQRGGLKNGGKRYTQKSIDNLITAKLYTSDSAVDFYLAAGYESSGEFEKAMSLYRKVIERNPNYKNINDVKKNLKRIMKKLGDSYFDRGKMAEAKRIYQRLIAVNGLLLSWGSTDDYERYAELMPDNLLAHYWLVRSYYDKGKWKDALKHLHDVKRLGLNIDDVNNMFISVSFQLAEHYKKGKQVKKALEYYLKAADLDKDNQHNIYAKAMLEAGNIYKMLNMLDKAKDAYLKLEALGTKRGEGYYLAAKMYEKSGMLAEAIDMYKRYLPFRPVTNTNIYITLGSVYERAGSLSEAKDTYLLLEENDTTKGQGFNLIGRMYERNRMWKEAISYYNKYLPYKGRSDINIFHVLGRLYTYIGDLKDAEKIYMKLEDINTVKGQGLNAIAEMYKNKGMMKEAIRFYEKYLAIDLNNLYVLNTLGYLYDHTDNISGAVKTYLALEKIGGEEGKGLYLIAKLYERRGMLKDALTYYKRYINGRLTNLKAIFSIADINNKLGKYKEAIVFYKTIIKRDPINSTGLLQESYLALGRLYSRINRKRESIAMYKRYNSLRRYVVK